MLPEENAEPTLESTSPTENQAPQRSERKMGKVWMTTMAALGLVAIVAGSSYAGWNAGRYLAHPRDSFDVAKIVAQTNPAIVNIETVTGLGKAAGTGMLLTAKGEILTNNHVIEGSTSITVTIAGHAPAVASVIGVDPTADVALLQVEGLSHLPTVKMAKGTVKVGDKVVAMGNAFGLGGAPQFSVGVVTAINQNITASAQGALAENLSGMIQANASISPGESGGALVNGAGEVVGMITAGLGMTAVPASTIGYAIPAANALRVVSLVRSGASNPEIVRAKVGYMGVAVGDLAVSTASELGIDGGALIIHVQVGGPAEKAGIRAGMIITGVEGVVVNGRVTLGPAIRSHFPGEQVKVDLMTSTGKRTIQVTLDGVNA